MANRLSGLLKAFAHVLPRHNTLRSTGRGLAGLLAVVGVIILAVIGIGKVSAAPAPCAVFCSGQGLTGPAKASCIQACRRCQGDVTKICPTPTAFVCCTSGQCCFDCTVGHLQCGNLCSIGYLAGACDDTCGTCGP